MLGNFGKIAHGCFTINGWAKARNLPTFPVRLFHISPQPKVWASSKVTRTLQYDTKRCASASAKRAKTPRKSSKKKKKRRRRSPAGYWDQNLFPLKPGTNFYHHTLIAKLSEGVRSSVWLAEADEPDFPFDRYCALKVFSHVRHHDAHREIWPWAANEEYTFFASGMTDERVIHIRFCWQEHGPWHEAPTPTVNRSALARDTLSRVWKQNKDLMTMAHLKAVLRNSILPGLAFLHDRGCQILHGELNAGSIFLVHKSEHDLAEYAEHLKRQANDSPSLAEIQNPQLESYDPSRWRWQIGNFDRCDVMLDWLNIEGYHRGEYIGPRVAKFSTPPEAIYRLPCTYSADIWALGMMMLELLGDKDRMERLCRHDNGTWSVRSHVASMASLVGAPPKDYIKDGPGVRKGHFDSDGNFKYNDPTKFNMTLSDMIKDERFSDPEDRNMCIAMIRRMLQWDPKSRPSAPELIDDPWLDEAKEVTPPLNIREFGRKLYLSTNWMDPEDFEEEELRSKITENETIGLSPRERYERYERAMTSAMIELRESKADGIK